MTDEEMLTNLNLLTNTLSEGSRMRIALEKAINLLSTECCTDHVSRSGLKDIISKLETKGNSRYGRDSIYGEAVYDFADEIRALSPEQLQPKTGWISVKDKLPDNIDDVLVTTDYDNVSVGYYRYCRDGSSNKEWYIYNKEYSNDVSAWMPLPKPYKEK